MFSYIGTGSELYQPSGVRCLNNTMSLEDIRVFGGQRGAPELVEGSA